MRPPLRRSRSRLVALLGLLFFMFSISFVFLAIVPADFSPPLQHRQLIEDNPIAWKTSEKLNSLKQEISGGLKVPPGIILKDSNYHKPVNDLRDDGAEEVKQQNISTFADGKEISGGLKVPPGIILKDSNYHEPVNDLRDDGVEEEVKQPNISTFADGKELSNHASLKELSRLPRQHPVINEKVSEMEDWIIVARAYLQFAPANANSHLPRELKQRIRELQKMLGHVRGANLPRGTLRRMKAMQDTLSKAKKAYPDCCAMASKLRAMTQNTEEQLRAQKNQASYLIQVAASTFPKGLHCLSMRLTTQYFALGPDKRQFPDRHKVQKEHLYHYAIFSDNVLACAVVVNSTISTSKAPGNIVFHVVTDSLNFPAMTMWFRTNPPGRATIDIQSMDDFKWLPPDFGSTMNKSGVRDPRFISPLNHIRFYLPDIFPHLNKILLLDHDVVVQKDLRRLWKANMKGKVIGVVETCDEDSSSHRLDTLVDFSEPTVAKNFDAKACLWAFGMNIVDLREWRRRGLSQVYNKWLQLGKKRQSWKAGSLPLGQLTFYNHTLAIDRWWHVLGLGQDSEIDKKEIETAAVIHFSGIRKPWLEIGNSRFRGYWNRFLNYDQPYLQQCNIHE